MNERWNEFKQFLIEEGYILFDEHEHTFQKDDVYYSYAAIEELESFAKIDEIALYVDTFEEVDKEYARIIAQGGQSVLEPTTEPWGQRTCYIADHMCI